MAQNDIQFTVGINGSNASTQLKQLDKQGKEFKRTMGDIAGQIPGLGGLSGIIGGLGAGPAGWAAVAAGSVVGLVAAINALNESLQKSKDLSTRLTNETGIVGSEKGLAVISGRVSGMKDEAEVVSYLTKIYKSLALSRKSALDNDVKTPLDQKLKELMDRNGIIKLSDEFNAFRYLLDEINQLSSDTEKSAFIKLIDPDAEEKNIRFLIDRAKGLKTINEQSINIVPQLMKAIPLGLGSGFIDAVNSIYDKFTRESVNAQNALLPNEETQKVTAFELQNKKLQNQIELNNTIRNQEERKKETKQDQLDLVNNEIMKLDLELSVKKQYKNTNTDTRKKSIILGMESSILNLTDRINSEIYKRYLLEKQITEEKDKQAEIEDKKLRREQDIRRNAKEGLDNQLNTLKPMNEQVDILKEKLDYQRWILDEGEGAIEDVEKGYKLMEQLNSISIGQNKSMFSDMLGLRRGSVLQGVAGVAAGTNLSMMSNPVNETNRILKEIHKDL